MDLQGLFQASEKALCGTVAECKNLKQELLRKGLCQEETILRCAVQRLQDRNFEDCQQAAQVLKDLSHEEIHTGHWSNIDMVWRSCFGAASMLYITASLKIVQQTQEQPSKDSAEPEINTVDKKQMDSMNKRATIKQLLNLLRELDLCIILGAPDFNEYGFQIISELHEILVNNWIELKEVQIPGQYQGINSVRYGSKSNYTNSKANWANTQLEPQNAESSEGIIIDQQTGTRCAQNYQISTQSQRDNQQGDCGIYNLKETRQSSVNNEDQLQQRQQMHIDTTAVQIENAENKYLNDNRRCDTHIAKRQRKMIPPSVLCQLPPGSFGPASLPIPTATKPSLVTFRTYMTSTPSQTQKPSQIQNPSLNPSQPPQIGTLGSCPPEIGTPVVLLDCISAWPALNMWRDPDYLIRTAGMRTVPVEVGVDYRHPCWCQQLMRVHQFLEKAGMVGDWGGGGGGKGAAVDVGDSIEGGAGRNDEGGDGNERRRCEEVLCGDVFDEVHPPPPLTLPTPLPSSRPPTSLYYIAQHPLLQQIPQLQSDVMQPDYCSLSTHQHTPVKVNTWLGPAGTQTPLHYDKYHNLLCQVLGTKFVRLYPPRAGGVLGQGAGDLGANTSDVDVWEAGAGGDEWYECVLEEGECLYIPPFWWHYVQAVSSSWSVSWWWE